MRSHANRGMSFESYLEYTNNVYKSDGIAVITKQPTPFKPIWDRRTKRIVNCKVDEKATVDYIGRYRDIPVAIEAKETAIDNIRFDRVQSHQQRFLDGFTKHEYGFGAVIVSFNMQRYFLVPWVFWKAAIEAWNEMSWIKKIKGKNEKICIKVEYKGMTWVTPGKASVKAAELLPEWEIVDNNLKLPYLDKIDTYMN